ncbi:hypothetical protein OIU84_019525 [Salix udensis]|uniref:RING/FYVE/PHD zinc finger superfamily protein n=1 Tax=Salix udensis TaxID=889485 RepID=A0AAD6KZ18_9ROSI|nr:hypothetical protein OIU84_019525 [Salix udensis]
MSDHVVLDVDRLIRPAPAAPAEESDKAIIQEDDAGASCSRANEGSDDVAASSMLIGSASSIGAMRKGDITCEICHQPYQPGYTAPPRPPHTEDTAIDIGGGWTISGTQLDLQAEYDDYAASNASGAAFCRSVALILMALLLLRHALTATDSDGEDDVSTFFSLFLLRAAGFLLPCYIMAWAISILQRRRQRQEAAALAATQVAFVLQSGQQRGLQFTIAPGPAVTPHQEPV